MKIPEYDIRTQKRVAYGPPGTERHKLVLKIVPKDTFVETNQEVSDDKFDDDIPKKDDFGEVDSNIDLDIKYDSRDPNISDEKEAKKPTSVVEADVSISSGQETSPIKNTLLRSRMQMHRDIMIKKHESSLSSISDTSNKDSSTSIEDVKHKKPVKKTDFDSDDDSISEVIDKIKIEYTKISNLTINGQVETIQSKANHVNPFKNVDPNISVFVDKLVSPILMVHSKMNKRFQPSFELRDVPFTTNIQVILKNMNVDRPMMIQTVSWFSILRGYSIFMISPKGSGKTMGYLPAVCRLTCDTENLIDNPGPVALIVCATAYSVSEVEKMSKIFVEKKKVLAFYAGMNELDMTTSLLNGCDILICTPSILVRLMQATDYGVDLRRLTTFVLDDCERLSEVYGNEIKYFQLKIKEMLKTRAEKELKVQYILASRMWCDFMEPLAKKSPDTVICIGAFQECVLYSKASTTASFVTKENKVNSVLDFMNQIDKSKKTVIVCRSDDEVTMLEKVLVAARHVVSACNNAMTIHDLYNLSLSLKDYQDPVLGPVLLCCDSNLTHLNITDAHNLIHFSLPQLFSMFCKRFSVLNDNYASLFNKESGDVRIKILLEDDNVEQLPKILNFIKRCTNEVPKVLDDICENVLAEKDVVKAKKMVPICDSLLALGECPDFWNCQERHAILKEFDKPKEWMPKNGVVTFKILHYHNPVLYSARLLTNIVNGQTHKYPQTYNKLSMQISIYFAKESNRKLHGLPEVGDVCAVSIKQNFFVRCQVVKILSHYPKGNPNYVLIKLIDEEKLERTRDIYLYYLPDDMKTPETYVAQIRLGNIQPKDKDITYSDLAKERLQKITDKDEDLYLRGRISLSIGNCIIVDTLETCRDLTSMNKTVLRHDFRQELLESHAISNPDHISTLEKLCQEIVPIKQQEEEPEIVKTVKERPEPRWAHLPDDLTAVYCAAAENPGTFFIRLVKFDDCINLLIKDIKKYVSETKEVVTNVNNGDIVIAKFPDDDVYERARIEQVYDENKVKCFFVDQGDWRDVSTKHLIPITEKLISQIPFQAIECKLSGIKPHGESWTEFSTNWFINCFDDNADQLKQLYAKYFTKEKAEHTGGHKYGVALVDTNSDKDILINQLMIDKNLAQEVKSEINNVTQYEFKTDEPKSCDEEWEKISEPSHEVAEITEAPASLDQLFLKKPIRSVPLVASDEESEGTEEKWNFNITDDFMALFKPMGPKLKPVVPAIKDLESVSIKSIETKSAIGTDSQSDSDYSLIKNPVREIANTKTIEVLDSDDLTSPEHTSLSQNQITPIKNLEDQQKKPKLCNLKSPQQTSRSQNPITPIENLQDQLRKPKLSWRQNKSTVTIKIMLIGVDNYNIEIKDRHLKFDAEANETKYGFEINLYGIVNTKLSSHSDKGQYILVHLTKIITKNWLTLTRDGGIRKWIVYDVDSIDTSSDEDEIPDDTLEKIVRSMHNIESESEDEDMIDDIDFSYKR